MKFAKVAGKIGVTAAASVAAIMMWGGGVARADTNWGPVTPVSGSIGGLFTGIKCLDVNSGDGYLNNNSRVLIWDCTGNNDQQWSLHLYGFTPDGAPLYQLINLMSRKCMEVRNDNTLNGTQVDQFTCQTSGDITAADTQLWRLSNANANGTYKRMQPWSAVRVGASMCLDIFNGDDDNGTKVEQWTCNGGGNQEFIGFPGSLSLPARAGQDR